MQFDNTRILILPSPQRNALRPQQTLSKLYNALNLLIVMRGALVSIFSQITLLHVQIK